MHAFDVLSDEVRRRLLELLASEDRTAGEVSRIVEREFEISQPAVSRHLRVLREAGFVTSRAVGARRLYSLQPAALDEIDATVTRYRALWAQRLDALATEVSRGNRSRQETDSAQERSS